MPRILMMVTSGFSGTDAALAIGMGRGLQQAGNQVSLCLAQDAVLGCVGAGTAPGSELLLQAVADGVRVFFLEDDLAMRGFEQAAVPEAFQPVDYARLVGLLMEEHDRVLGAF